MAGISQEVSPGEVLPLLARNASLYGYDRGRETEYLVLLDRYVHEARELMSLADGNGTIRVTGCQDATRLVRVLGYRFDQDCDGKDDFLVTENPERAFVTVDSGFPLTNLEQAIHKGEPFTYSFGSTQVPVFFQDSDWTGVTTWKKKLGDDLLNALLHDQNLDRLYAAFGKYNDETRAALKQSPGLHKLMSLAAVLDLYGGQINIRSGRVVVPGGADKAWEDLVGANVHSPGEFVANLLNKDDGWLAAYYDVLAQVSQTQQVHLTTGSRLRRFYGDYRSSSSRTSAAKGVFPKNGDLLILFTSLHWTPDDDLMVPGGLAVWEQILSEKARTKEMREVIKRTHGWDTSGRLLETLVAASAYDTESGPVQIFLTLSAINEARTAEGQLAAATDKLIAEKMYRLNQWFPMFAEFPALDDASVVMFVKAVDHVDGISNPVLRANALGAFQAEVGLWQIVARQGQIPAEKLNSSWQGTVQPFTGITSSVQLFEAARGSLQATLVGASGRPNLTQNEIIELLAGPVQNDPDGRQVRQDLAHRIHTVLDDQRLASLDTLFALFDGLTDMARGTANGSDLLPLAGELKEFELPRPIFTGMEKSTWAPAVYTSRHAELQIRTDLTRTLRTSASPSQLEAARGQLTPFLRDTLVGLNYAYYEPPGAEVLHNNPLFVRSHDFTSVSVIGTEQIWGEPQLIGVGATAGGGAYLMGSLADLPYALAATEEDFIAPKNVQALIWREVVPDLVVDAVLPRWWTVSRAELHAVSLYQKSGEELLKVAASDPDVRDRVMTILSDRMNPDRLNLAEEILRNPGGTTVQNAEWLPADMFYLAVEFRKRYPDAGAQWGSASKELMELQGKDPADTKPERLAADFGVPHPALIFSNSRGLMNMKPPCAFGGNANRLLAESWESNNLYWARLADEMGYSPAMLNLLVPTLTRRMITNIFASNIDDWPALRRAMEETGEEFRQGKIPVPVTTTIAQQGSN